MSKIKLTGSNSGYVEIDSAADAGNLTLTLPTAGTALLSNAGNVFSGITTTGQLDINGSIDVSSTSVFNDDLTLTGASYNVLWDKSDNQLEFGTNAKLSFGASSDLQIHRSGTHSYIKNSSNTLVFNSDAISLTNYAGNSNRIVTAASGEVKLYYSDSVKLETTNTGAVVTGICTATSFSGSGEGLTRTTQLSHRNKVINGDMRISQRGTSFTNIGGNAGDNYTLDRFKLQTNNLDQAVATVSQDSSAPDGFSKSLKIQCTTAETSVEDSEHARLMYDGEAFDFTDIGFGTSSAKKVTLSFWVKSNLTGTWGLNFWRGDANRSNLRTYTINSANTWEHKVITLSADTTGGGVNSDNGYGLRINWGLATGANFATSHPLDTWHGFQQQYFYPYDARNTNFYSSTSNNFYLTGVQLEVGEQATPFEHRSYAEELARCQRYFAIFPGRSGGIPFWQAYTGSNQCSCSLTIPFNMRTTPTPTDKGTGTSTTTGYCYNSNGAQVNSRYANNNAPTLSCGGYAPSGLGLIMAFGSHQSGTNDVTVASWNGSSPGIFLDAEL